MNKEKLHDFLGELVDLMLNEGDNTPKMKAVLMLEKVNRLNIKFMKLDNVDKIDEEKYKHELINIVNLADGIIEALNTILDDMKD